MLSGYGVLLVFDIILVIVGLVVLSQARKMKETGEVTDFIIPEQEMKVIHDHKKFAGEVSELMYKLAVVLLISGGASLFNSLVIQRLQSVVGRVISIALAVIFVAAWVVFSRQLEKIKAKYRGY